jgi:cellulose synthase operon protein C
MKRRVNWTVLTYLLTAFVSLELLGAGVVVAAGTDSDKEKEKILQKIQALEEEKAKAAARLEKTKEDTKPSGKTLAEIIAKYEKLLDGCVTKKSERCADVMATLGSLYYDEAKDTYIQRRNQYEEQMKVWEQKQMGPEPVSPIPDYTRPLRMYRRFASEYPEHPKLDEAYYQIGAISLVLGDLDSARIAFEAMVTKFPNSRRCSGAYFRLADFAYIEHDYAKALKCLEKMDVAQVPPEILEMAQYRKAELHYNMGDFEIGAQLFFGYREGCDAGTFRKCDLRDDALEFLAICFSDMPEGADKCIRFFRDKGGRPYEAQVLYMVGMKNRVHGQYDDAIKALQAALKRFPYYKDAPLAQQALVECFLIKKQYDLANDGREKLVDYYGEGGEWYTKNADQKAVIEQSRNEVKKALSSIAVYYHVRAEKTKDKADYERALKRYLTFFQRFPDDKWMIYELKNNVADIYNKLQDYDNAAKYYDYVASEDLSSYPKFAVDLDTLGFDQDEIERMKKEREGAHKSISQEDAGYNVIVCLDNARKKAIAKSGLTEDKAYNLPETQKFLEYIRKFQQRFPQSGNAADVLYLGANVDYSAKAYQTAIPEFQNIINSYPTSQLAGKALRLLANCYVNTGEYDLAFAKYRELLSKYKPETQEYQEVVDLAAGAMYKKATGMKDGGNYAGAADAFKSINTSFASSKLGDRGWFEAGDCYEKMNNLELAAATFEAFPTKFAKSELMEKALVRSAEDYKKAGKLEQAAQVYTNAAGIVSKAEFAIPSLAAAAQCYIDLKKFDMAGKVYGTIYERYANDPKAPQALYNAGMIFEKGNMYDEAIKVYITLAERFPKSEYAGEAFYSVGLCDEKMGNKAEMARVFTDFAARFPDDRYKQVEALVKAGDAYYDMKALGEAEKSYTTATVVYKEFQNKADMDPGSIARACYKLGDIRYQQFLDLKLDGNNEKAIKDQTISKTKGLEEAAKLYAKAIEIGVEEWTVRATYMLGQGFVELATAVGGQRLFGRKDEQVASKIKILSSLEKYYSKAQEYFYKNVEWAYEQGVKGEYVDKSEDRFMEMAFLKGDLLEQVGLLFRDAPVPADMEADEKIAYKELLEEKYLAALDAALPKYVEAVKAAREVGIPQSRWLDKARERIAAIKPDDESLTWNIEKRAVKAQPEKKEVVAAGDKKRTVVPPPSTGSPELDRALRRIRNIAGMQIPLEEKVKQLSRIETDAQRNMTLEEEKIKQLREALARQK